ncbi:MAG: ATP-binding protein, partial [Chloroflexota bacterium]
RGDNLPYDPTSFIGREHETAEVRRLLDAHRLVTLAGPGGVGKTRLAVEVARGLVEAHPDGVWLVALGPLADPDLVPRAIAAAAGVELAPGRPPMAALADTLRPRQLLLVLDNCEHLVEACAAAAEALLRDCPQVRLLATSREPFGCAGETVCRVPSLALPPPGGVASVEELLRSDAVRLFVERAATAAPDLALTVRNAPAVADICRRLDGIPLALELAAALVRGLSVDEIAARLDDRFRLLTGGRRTALPRHQTLRALVDWSYDLLAPAEQALFARLAVFAGGFTLEGAEAVGGTPADDLAGAAVGDVLTLLLRLVDTSLVLAERSAAFGSPDGPDGDEGNAPARFRLLETLREYGRERLASTGEAERVRRRHFSYCLRLLDQRAQWGATGATEAVDGRRHWARRLEVERDNVSAALQWARDQDDTELGDQLAEAIPRVAIGLTDPVVRRALTPIVAELRRLQLPAYGALQRALTARDDLSLLAPGADLYHVIGDWSAELAVLQRCLALEGDAAAATRIRLRVARLLLFRQDGREASALLDTILPTAEADGDDQLLFEALLEQGYAAAHAGDCHQGRAAYARALVLLEDFRPTLPGTTYQRQRLAVLRGHGCLAHNADDNEAGVASHAAAAALAQTLDDRPQRALALVNLADAHWGCWRYGVALQTYRAADTAAAEASYTEARAFAALGQGIVRWSIGQHAAAAPLLQQGLALARDLGDVWGTAYGLTYLSAVQASQGALREALRTSADALALAEGLGPGYALALAQLYH